MDQPKRMTSLDRKIEAAQGAAEEGGVQGE